MFNITGFQLSQGCTEPDNCEAEREDNTECERTKSLTDEEVQALSREKTEVNSLFENIFLITLDKGTQVVYCST